MALHQTSGRSALGAALAGVTVVAWGILPLALTVVLAGLDPVTLTWFRFVGATALLGVWLWRRGALPDLRALDARQRVLLLVATLGLGANYVLYVMGLGMTTPATTQVLTQLSPLLLALGGIVVFHERLSVRQWGGFLLVGLGLALFFTDQLAAFVASADRYLLGSLLLACASLVWAVYGLAQKQLLVSLRSPSLLLCLYAGCAIGLTPLAEPRHLAALDGLSWGLLIFCALNTLIAYGAFAASLEHLPASRVGALIALTPLATFALVALADAIWPGSLPPEHFSPGMLAGALVVVVGSVLTARD
jgi:drug/metabolite transporter (DMT)-like permease